MSIARRSNLISRSSTRSTRAIFPAKHLHAYSFMCRHGQARSTSKLIALQQSEGEMASRARSSAVMSTGARGAVWKIVGVCGIAAFVVQLDGAALNVALPQIGRSFGVPLAVLQWVVDAYWLLHACLLLSTGAASDRFGPRRVFVCGYGLFAAASVICALSPAPEMLIAGRALQG